jgi:hypothetical protein
MEVINTTSTADPVYMYNYMNSYIMKPFVFIVFLIIVVIYLIYSDYLGNYSDDSNSSFWSKSFGYIIIFIILILILFNALQYFFSINITAYINGLFTPKTTLNIVVNDQNNSALPPSPIPEIKWKNQVFNIPGNVYNYENAKALCTAYGAKLANYSQIEEAYKEGGEWCNYGWSDGQMALFPTQKNTFDKLQTINGHEHDCGRPGINGGYIANPQIKFGVNCYGHKPKMTNEEEQLMETTTPYPESAKDIAFQKRVDYWRNKIDEILVSPFDYKNWSV